ncbi:conjugal transfer protein TraF [Desulfurobacterium sp. TC5-1]|uniref:conjugal transfer protein TraF n=1 Tax=Desulfurobacterium sp. TC5-1 TaxID=1158318 RepID=UPI0003B56E76|nr:conjugal transfer protein TraF [Desulfurobacterium sp. TC5-1]
MRRLLIFILLMILSGKVNAKSFFEQKPGEGWFHYNWHTENKTSDTEKKKTYSEKEFEVVLYPDKLDNMTAEQIRKLEEKLRGFAVMKPTLRNVYLYLKLTQYIKSKAEKFVNVSSEVAHLYPDVSETPPTSTVARRIYLKEEKRKIENTIKENADRIALTVFEKPGCSYCRAQNNILRFLKDKYGIYIKVLNVYEYPQMAERFQVKTTPTTWLVYEDSENEYKWVLISAGLVSLDQLEESIYKALIILQEGKYYGKNG